MKVWKDILSGDEMVSDSYPHEESFGGACLEVKSRLLTKKENEDFGIAGKFKDQTLLFLWEIIYFHLHCYKRNVFIHNLFVGEDDDGQPNEN